MEFVDIFDEEMNSIGRMTKKEAHRTGAWHKSIHCWIVRSDETANMSYFKREALLKRHF